MITSQSGDVRYQIAFSDGIHEGFADTTKDKGGSHSGFRPHDLLEAALAACMNMWIRMYADHHNLPLSGAIVNVQLDRSRAEEVIFRYSVDLKGELSETQYSKLVEIAGTCPVHRTLSKKLTFQLATAQR